MQTKFVYACVACMLLIVMISGPIIPPVVAGECATTSSQASC